MRTIDGASRVPNEKQKNSMAFTSAARSGEKSAAERLMAAMTHPSSPANAELMMSPFTKSCRRSVGLGVAVRVEGCGGSPKRSRRDLKDVADIMWKAGMNLPVGEKLHLPKRTLSAWDLETLDLCVFVSKESSS
jgi:hypothetical protein